MGIARKIGAAAAASATVAGLSLAAAVPAEAASLPSGWHAAITTPRYGMSCILSVLPQTVAGVTQYEGGAMCFSDAPFYLGPWQVKVNCTFGSNYYSGVFTPSSTAKVKFQTPAFLCFWGVNSVEVIEV